MSDSLWLPLSLVYASSVDSDLRAEMWRTFIIALRQVSAMCLLTRDDFVHRDMVLKPLHMRLETPVIITMTNLTGKVLQALKGIERIQPFNGDLCSTKQKTEDFIGKYFTSYTVKH